MWNEITPSDLHSLLQDPEKKPILIDVREAYEYEHSHLPAQHIPLFEIAHRYPEIPREGPVVLYCRSGSRSLQAVRFLATDHGFTNLMNLRGGLLAWQLEVDPEFPVY